MKLIKKNLPIIIIIILFLIMPVFTLNAGSGTDVSGTTKIDNPIGNITTIQGFLVILLQGAIKIGMPIVTLAVIYSGFLFVKAQGNPEEITKAKEALLYTMIGAAVLLGAWAIANAILDTVTSLST
jgi:hypothetical protein